MKYIKIYLLVFLVKANFSGVAQTGVYKPHQLSYKKTSELYSAEQKSGTFRLLSCNILEGFGGSDSLQHKFSTWVKVINPDVIALQEMNGFTPHKLRKLADGMGYPYAVLQKTEGYPLAFISKHPIENVKIVTEGMWHGLLYAKIKGYHLFNTHLDPKTYHTRLEEVDVLLKHVNQISKKEKVAIMGDFNNMSPQDSLAYKQKSKMNLLLRSESNRPEIKILKDGDIEFSAIQSILSNGFSDSFLKFNEVYDKTAPTKVKKHNNYTRIDFVFLNKVLSRKAVNALIVKDDFTDYLSDHYPVFVEFKK